MLKLKKPVKAQNKNRVRPRIGRTLPKATDDSDMYNRAFPVGNALFLFVGGMMSLFRLPRGKRPLALLAVPTGKDGRVECPRQTVNDFIGIRGSVCGLFLFVQTHVPLDICEQHTMCLISVSHIVMFAEKTYNAFEPVGHTKRRKERES